MNRLGAYSHDITTFLVLYGLTVYLPCQWWRVGTLYFCLKSWNESKRTYYDLYLYCKHNVRMMKRVWTSIEQVRERERERESRSKLHWPGGHNKRGNYTEHSSIFSGDHGKHMFNIHLEDIMRFHAFTIIRDVAFAPKASLGLGQITKTLTLKCTHTNTYIHRCIASLLEMSIQELNNDKKRRSWIVVATIGRTLEALCQVAALLHSLVSEGAFSWVHIAYGIHRRFLSLSYTHKPVLLGCLTSMRIACMCNCLMFTCIQQIYFCTIVFLVVAVVVAAAACCSCSQTLAIKCSRAHFSVRMLYAIFIYI